jgi:hypothetical protein
METLRKPSSFGESSPWAWQAADARGLGEQGRGFRSCAVPTPASAVARRARRRVRIAAQAFYPLALE